MTSGSVWKITSNLNHVATGPEPSRDGWMWKEEGSGVTLADSRIGPVLGQATCFFQPTASVLAEIKSTSFFIKDI